MARASKHLSNLEIIKEAAELDLLTFIKLVAPHRLLGAVHEELIHWWGREDAKSHQLVLLPRGHQKSAMVAYRVAWEITRNPEITILYISATANLAQKQLKAIKDILSSSIYRKYWPEMIIPEEAKRELWNVSEIAVDHPKRKLEGVRDPTVFTAGLNSTITGMHCDIAVLDDVVIRENAYTTEGRQTVTEAYSLLSSVENTGAKEWAVGTRYHPKDLYKNLIEMSEALYNEEGEQIGDEPVYEVFERQVENRGDGTGEFLWPRQRRPDGKLFGFDVQTLAKKKAQYLDQAQFRAQYYNDPNDPDNAPINPDRFQYYDQHHLNRMNGKWHFKGRPLNIVAAIDFAYSLTKRADYTSLVVIGIDPDSNIYVLDVERFKTDKVSEYFNKIVKAQVKWDFRKLRAEVTAAQAVIVREMKDGYIRPNGVSLSIDEHRPTRYQGSKEERMQAILQPRYDNLKIWHYKGGMCQVLEEELLAAHPSHDDVKDAMASAIEIAVPPANSRNSSRTQTNQMYHSRFGGVRI